MSGMDMPLFVSIVIVLIFSMILSAFKRRHFILRKTVF